MDCSPQNSSVHGIFQEKILEWVAISSSRGFSQSQDWIGISCLPFIGRRIVYHCATWDGSLKVIQIVFQLILQLWIEQEEIKIASALSAWLSHWPVPTAQPQPRGMVDCDTVDLFNPQVCTEHQLYARHLSRVILQRGWLQWSGSFFVCFFRVKQITIK